jgi:hypothetical protein
MHDLPVHLLARLDSWRLRQFPAPSRAEVIATLVEIAMRRDEAVLNSTDGCLERLRAPRHHAHSAKLAQSPRHRACALGNDAPAQDKIAVRCRCRRGNAVEMPCASG